MSRGAIYRRCVVQVRLTAERKALVAAAAAREHRSISDWIRHLIRRELVAVGASRKQRQRTEQLARPTTAPPNP